MINEWALRDEILAATHRWQQIIAFCLLGAFVGWGISFLWPSPSRATQELYVGLNVYQAVNDRNAAEQAGLVFSNVNDYKNWQMASLNSIIYTDGILDETLERLGMVDPYWQDVSRGELAAMLHVYWRNAGKWRLVAEHRDARRAAQAVTAWQAAVLEQVKVAVQQARQAWLLDRQFQAIVTQQAQKAAPSALLVQARNGLSDGSSRLASTSPAQPVSDSERQLLEQQVSLLQGSTSWRPLSQAFPPPGAPLSAYQAWVAQAIALVDQEIQAVQTQTDVLEQEKQALAARYSQAVENSLGLSAELKVDQISDTQPQLSQVRPTGTLILIGAILGLIAWLVVWLARPAMRGRQ
jgi:hypothetical protein